MQIVENFQKFPLYPLSLKRGIVFLFAAWIWYFFFILSSNFILHTDLLPAPIMVRQMIAGVMACGIIFVLKNWARVLCILGSVMVLIQILPGTFELYRQGRTLASMLLLSNDMLFILSIFYLASAETTHYLKQFTPARESGEPKTEKEDN